MFQFSEGAVVALELDNSALDLTAGVTGIVRGLYTTMPPSYGVTFEGKDGRKFDVTMSEEGLMAAPRPRELASSERH